MTAQRVCDTCGRTDAEDWIKLTHRRARWDFCSPACFHAAGPMLSAVLPAPWVTLPGGER